MSGDTRNLFVSIISLILIAAAVMQAALWADAQQQKFCNPTEKNITVFDRYVSNTIVGSEYTVCYSIENSTDIIEEDNISLYYHVEIGNTYRAVFFNENSIQRIGLL